MVPPPWCWPDHRAHIQNTGQSSLWVQGGCSLTYPRLEPLHCSPRHCSGSVAFESPVIPSHLGEQQRREWSGGQEERQSLGESAWILCLCWGRNLAETYREWKHVASSSLILWQQRYDLPVLPTSNNMPELIGGIRRSQLLLE